MSHSADHLTSIVSIELMEKKISKSNHGNKKRQRSITFEESLLHFQLLLLGLFLWTNDKFLVLIELVKTGQEANAVVRILVQLRVSLKLCLALLLHLVQPEHVLKIFFGDNLVFIR